MEDRLQDKTPETIKRLREANISFWMLTGDKMGTAINIGYSCKLLERDFNIIQIKAKNDLVEIEKKQNIDIENKSKNALVINGLALGECEMGEVFKIIEKCSVVIACRVSPKQKAEIVKE